MSSTRDDVLNGWKEIAAYLGRDPRTVERWEKTRSLPVRRMPGGGRATVYALIPEVDAWLSGPLRAEDRAASTQDASTSQASPLIPVETGAGDQDAKSAHPAREEAAPTLVGGTLRRSPLGLAAVLLIGIGCGLLWLSVSQGRLVSTLHATGRSHARLARSPMPGVEDLYLRGTYQAELRTPESLRRAQSAFTEALQRDPSYAPAWAGIASTYILAREYDTIPESTAYSKAKDAAMKAVALDPDLSEAHSVLGFVDFFWAWDVRSAEREFQLALKLEPGLALAHHWHGSMLTHEGQFGAALRELNEAQRLSPNSSAIMTTRALALGWGRSCAEGTALLDDALSLERGGQFQNPATMHAVMGTLSLLQPRNVPRSLAENMLASQLRGDLDAVVGWKAAIDVYHSRGERGMWEFLLARERSRSLHQEPTYAMARFEAELGRKDDAMECLTKLYGRHDSALIGMAVDPLLLPLHGDPRYKKLRQAMGLPTADLS